MIEEISGGLLRGIFAVIQWILIEFVWNIAICGPGYLVRRTTNKDARIDDAASFFVGLSIWVIIIGVVVLLV